MKIVIHAGSEDRPAGPVAVQVPVERLDPKEMIGLLDCDQVKPLPVQTDTRGRLVWWCDALGAGQTRTYRLNSAGLLQDVGRVVVHEAPGAGYASIVRPNGGPARYYFGQDGGRPRLALTHGDDGDTALCDILAGWASLDGIDYLQDHEPVGLQQHRRFSLCASGPVLGRLGMVIDWFKPDGQPHLIEHRSFVIYNSPPECVLIDMLVRLRMVAPRCTFEDTAAGGLCTVHCASEQLKDLTFSNAEGGSGMDECWGQTANWCDISGVVNGRPIGVTVMDSPENMRHPTYWNVSQQPALLAANPFGLGAFLKKADVSGSRTWSRDETTMFRYRILVHEHPRCHDEIQGFYESFTKPVRIEVH